MSGATLGILVFALFFIFMFLKMPVALSMGLSGFIGLLIKLGLTATLEVVGKEFHSQFMSYTLSVVPMFVFMGFLCYHAGIGSGLFNFFNKLVGHKKGGLLYASTFANAVFGAICGSPTAAGATMGSICYPEMKKYGYDTTLSTASIASGGILSVLIPPSMAFIMFGILTEESIGGLFMSGIFPGILLMLCFCVAIWVVLKRKPELAPAGPKSTFKETVKAAIKTIDVIIIFVVCLGGLFIGWFTPTEAGAVGSLAVCIVSLVKRTLTWKVFVRAVKDTAKTTAMVLFLTFGAQILSRLITVTGLASILASTLGGLAVPPIFILILVVIIIYILGFFIEALALTLIVIPVFYPLVVTTLGFDPYFFAALFVLTSSAGMITPPVGLLCYVVSGVCKTPVGKVFKGVWPFLIATVVATVLLIAFPQLASFLPNL
ncbi:MAG: TRAP transporter large permease [Oscillospiraceae bacterium]|nr:TRAP transporter large permease [Oscillospiraceae bacterium]